jgi:hypothetical protein
VDAVRAERFAQFDEDGDDVLDLQEYEALWLDAMRTRMVRAFQRLDIDGDAQVHRGGVPPAHGTDGRAARP